MGALAYTLPPLGGPKHDHFVKATISGDIQGRPYFLLVAARCNDTMFWDDMLLNSLGVSSWLEYHITFSLPDGITLQCSTFVCDH